MFGRRFGGCSRFGMPHELITRLRLAACGEYSKIQSPQSLACLPAPSAQETSPDTAQEDGHPASALVVQYSTVGAVVGGGKTGC